MSRYRELMLGLLRIRVKPYYLFHCDNVEGGAHFMTSIEKGQKIIASLFAEVSGYAIPRYVITTPASKIPLEKSYLSKNGNRLSLEDRDGSVQELPENLYGASPIKL
jgi:lysine 2,3-aminomutase